MLDEKSIEVVMDEPLNDLNEKDITPYIIPAGREKMRISMGTPFLISSNASWVWNMMTLFITNATRARRTTRRNFQMLSHF
jgi:hypothetical protein